MIHIIRNSGFNVTAPSNTQAKGITQYLPILQDTISASQQYRALLFTAFEQKQAFVLQTICLLAALEKQWSDYLCTITTASNKHIRLYYHGDGNN
jgi:hypothetical protein